MNPGPSADVGKRLATIATQIRDAIERDADKKPSPPKRKLSAKEKLDEIVVEAMGKNALLFKTDFGRVANLTLRQADGGKFFAVDIGQGRLELDGCDISSNSLICLAIYGGADPRIRRNRIHDGKTNGVLVHTNGKGTLEDNDITSNGNPRPKPVGYFPRLDCRHGEIMAEARIYVNSYLRISSKGRIKKEELRNRIVRVGGHREMLKADIGEINSVFDGVSPYQEDTVEFRPVNDFSRKGFGRSTGLLHFFGLSE